MRKRRKPRSGIPPEKLTRGGRDKVAVIWKLWAIMHNIGKIVLYRPGYGTKVAAGG